MIRDQIVHVLTKMVHLWGTVAVVGGLAGCRLSEVGSYEEPAVTIPSEFSRVQSEAAPGPSEVPAREWWRAFEDEELDRLVAKAQVDNLGLRQAWSRLAQAEQRYRVQTAERYPAVDLRAGGRREYMINRDQPTPMGGTTTTEGTTARLFAGGGLSWEIDLWRRVDSLARAERLETAASRQDVEETALVLSGEIATTWFQIREQTQLISVLQRQVELSRQFLELTELRFAVGEGSALNVLEQRQQLNDTESLLPSAMERRDTLENRLAVLVGQAPASGGWERAGERFGDLPPLPSLGSPTDLVESRPDLRAERLRLEAADYRVAAAVADRLPRLTLSLDYELSASKLTDLYENEVRSVAGNLVAPVFDGGRRKAEVERRREIVRESLDRFSESFLTALREVEDALVRERYQDERLEKIRTGLGIARENLSESRVRYANGLNDYLTVITALQRLQQLERDEITAQREVFEARAQLYRALGGAWTSNLEDPRPPVAAQSTKKNREESPS